jgi:hypothetical protein
LKSGDFVGNCWNLEMSFQQISNKYPAPVRVGNVTLKIYRSRKPKTKSGWAYSIAAQDEAGRRRLIQVADEREAWTRAEDMARALNAGEGDGATMGRADVRELAAARKICNGHPLLSALQEWAKIRELAGANGITAAEAWAASNAQKAPVKMKVSDAVNSFITEKDADGAQGEQTYRRKLAHLVRGFEERFLDEITERELSDFLLGFKDAVTRNDIRKRCVTLWLWARDKKGFLPARVTTAIERTSRAKEPTRKIGIISPDVFAQCLQWVWKNQPEDLAALVIAGFCGVRSDEIHGKRIEKKGGRRGGKWHGTRTAGQMWADIQLDAGLLNVSDAKENTPAWRLVPVCKAAMAWLQLCPHRADGKVCRPAAME